MVTKRTVFSVLGGGLLLLTAAGQVQSQHEVEGTVYDEQGNVTPGVNILVKGTNTGTSADVGGEFSLTAPSPNDTLVFSYVGYERLEEPIDGREYLEVTLEPSAILGEEAVVVAYGTRSRRQQTGSISSIQTEEMNTVAQSSINQMLQGQAPGLNMTTRSAQPGGGVSVNIRGALSPQGNNQPLYVIDGVPITQNSSTMPGLFDEDDSGGVLGFHGGVDRDPLSYLNASDIESITVMKDGSAAAIYGSAAANGVVLIETKRGVAGDVQVNYRGNYTTQRPHDYIPLMNARQFMENQDRLAREYHRYENSLPPYGDNDPGNFSYSRLFDQEQIENAGEGTYWPDLVMRDGYVQEHNLSISGGTEQSRVYGSFNFQDNSAILKNSTMSRYSGRLNVDHQIGDYVNFGIRSTVSRIDGNNPTTGGSIGGAEAFHMIEAASAYAPNIDVYDEETGDYNRTYNTLIMNPVSFLDMTDESETVNIFVAPELEMNFTDNVMGTIRGQYDTEKTTRSFYLPRTSNHTNLSDGMAQKNESSRENLSVEGFATWSENFENSNFEAVLGGGAYKVNQDGFGLVGIGFFTDAFGPDNVGAAEDAERNRLESWRNERTKLSQFVRFNYTLYDRYNFSGVVRRDGSSIFAEENKWGIFPSISGSWNISDESFMQGLDRLSELRVRLGYGLTGNESVLSGNTLQLYSPDFSYLIGNTLRRGVALSQVANPDLTWESVYSLNAGIDFGLFQNRLRGEIDVYQNTARDLLDFNPLPFNNAVGQVADNVGATRSRGIELSLTTINVSSGRFRWMTNFNASYNESHWLERNPQVPLPDYVDEQDPLGAIYGWETNGIITSEDEIPGHMPNANLGNLIYVDQNDDGQLNSDDVVLLGSSMPDWSLGMGNEVSVGNFDFRVFIYGDFGFQRYNNYAPNVAGLRLTGAPVNTTELAEDVWSSDNPDGTRPGVAPNPYVGNNPEGDDFDLEDADFIRISDISMSYSFPPNWIDATGAALRSARVFVNMEEIGVLTGYSGFDPEYTEPNPYPRSYSVTAGIELQF